MNSKKRRVLILIIIFVVLFGMIFLWIIPSGYSQKCKKRVFADLEKDSEKIKRSVVGIIPEDEENGLKNHNSIGSGVIFDKKDNTYYALTAAHVVEKKSNYKLFTINTEFVGKELIIDDGIKFEIPDEIKVTLKDKGTNLKKTDIVLAHNAPINFGNSGGVAISENMKIAGINIGGSFTLLGYFHNGYMIPHYIVEEDIKNWSDNL